MRELLVNLYWRACQYPWHTLVNLGFSLVILILATRFGPTLLRLVGEKAPVLSIDSLPASIRLILGHALTYLLFSLSVTAISALLLIHKGIVFGFLGYTFFFWFLFMPMRLVYCVIWSTAFSNMEKFLMVAGAFVLLLALSVSLFYFPNRIRTRHIVLQTSKVKRVTSVLHLSDIHAERYGAREDRLVSLVNAQQADLILITGDVFIAPYELNVGGFKAAVKILEQLNARHGIFIVEGHHDCGTAYHLVEALPQKVKLLNDEWAELPDTDLSIFGASLHGRSDASCGDDNGDRFKIFMAHEPVLLQDLNTKRFDLVLFGHTHAGQVYIPVVSRLICGKYRHGLYHDVEPPVHVSAGVGLEGFLAPRIRFLTYPEITVIELRGPK